jgi:shikimate dehydrogenase
MSDEPPLLAGVCGFPIGHSKSPVLFAHWFREHGIPGHYVPLRIAPEAFETVLRALPRAGFRGVNVTVPHKQAALALADRATPAARTIGAANTLTFDADGSIAADNTDAYGFIANLRAGAPVWQPRSGPAVLLGAGGAARAAAHVLLEAGVPVLRLTNRTRDRAEELARHFGERVEVVDWPAREASLEGAATIVNATSLGMLGKPPLDLALDAAPATALVTDMVYNPLVTPLLAAARARGMPTVDGLGMLLHQARPGFRAWFGPDPQVTEALRAACLAAG